MRRHRTLQVILGLSWLLVALDGLALRYHWYWFYGWLDLVTHVIGGMCIGLSVLWLVRESGYLRTRPPISDRVLVLVAGLGVGTVWEIYEYAIWFVGGRGLPAGYGADTLLDLVMGLFGAGIAYVGYSAAQKNTP